MPRTNINREENDGVGGLTTNAVNQLIANHLSSTPGAVEPDKGVVVDSNKDIGTFGTLTANSIGIGGAPYYELDVVGDIGATGSFIIGSAHINETELEQLDDITPGTVVASKAVIVDANKDISSFSNLTSEKIISTDITDSSSSITGAITTAGGLGVAKNLYVGGGLLDVSSTASAQITIAADTENDGANTEVPTLVFSKDGGTVSSTIGISAGDSGTFGIRNLQENDIVNMIGGIVRFRVSSSNIDLGANLDVKGFNIVTTASNQDIDLDPHGTGSVRIYSNLSVQDDLIIGSASLNETDITKLDGVTNGIVTSNKVVVVDTNKDISGFNDLTVTNSIISANFQHADLSFNTVANGSMTCLNAKLNSRLLFQNKVTSPTDLATGVSALFQFTDGHLYYKSDSVTDLNISSQILENASNIVAPVRLVGTSNFNSLSGHNKTLDGFDIDIEDRVLLIAQNTASTNGIWIVKGGTWVRPVDWSPGVDCAGKIISVKEGSLYADALFTCSSDTCIIDTDSPTFKLQSMAKPTVSGMMPTYDTAGALTFASNHKTGLCWCNVPSGVGSDSGQALNSGTAFADITNVDQEIYWNNIKATGIFTVLADESQIRTSVSGLYKVTARLSVRSQSGITAEERYVLFQFRESGLPDNSTGLLTSMQLWVPAEGNRSSYTTPNICGIVELTAGVSYSFSTRAENDGTLNVYNWGGSNNFIIEPMF